MAKHCLIQRMGPVTLCPYDCPAGFCLRKRWGSAPKGGGYTLEAIALFAAMPTQPSALRKGLIDTTIRDLMSSGIWAKLDLFYMLAAQVQDQAILNWKNPGTNTLTENNSPTFEANKGYTGDGATMSLSAAYTNVLYTQDNGHIACFGLTNTTSNFADAGVATITPGSRGQIQARNGIGSRASVGINAVTAAVTGANVPVLCAGDRADDASNQTVWINGALDTTAAVASTSTVCVTVNILANGIGSFTDRQVAFFSNGASLSAPQHAALNSIVRSYLSGVGAI